MFAWLWRNDAAAIPQTDIIDGKIQWKQYFNRLWRGLWIKIHAIGDRAIRFTIDSYEKAIKTYGANGCRHAIEHVEMVTDSDIERFGQLDLIPSVQPEHLGLMPTWEGEEYRVNIGEERAVAAAPFRTETVSKSSGLRFFSSLP